MIVNRAATYSASATDAHKRTADETTQKNEKSEVAGDLYTFEQFFKLAHLPKTEPTSTPTPTQNPLHGRLISDKTRTHSSSLD